MERLTEKDRYSQDYKIQAKNLNSHCVAKDKKGYVTYYGQHVDKLAEYEDAEEQGLLLRLPCKVGDIVYLIKSDGKIVPRTADMQFLGVLWEDYGKEWFLTQAEAEQKLKEMNTDNGITE